MSHNTRWKRRLHAWAGKSQISSALFDLCGLVLSPNSYLRTSGWLRSSRQRVPLSGVGDQLPWMNYSLVELLDERLHSQLSLFEYGSGYSTRFFANRVKVLYSVEHDQDWFEAVKKLKPCNANVYHESIANERAYIETIFRPERAFDVVIVDGVYRNECVKTAVGHLSAAGVLILDDTERSEYDISDQHMKRLGFKSLAISGLKPCSFRRSQSTIYYRSKNVLDL